MPWMPCRAVPYHAGCGLVRFGFSLGYVVSQLVPIKYAALCGVLISLIFSVALAGNTHTHSPTHSLSLAQSLSHTHTDSLTHICSLTLVSPACNFHSHILNNVFHVHLPRLGRSVGRSVGSIVSVGSNPNMNTVRSFSKPKQFFWAMSGSRWALEAFYVNAIKVRCISVTVSLSVSHLLSLSPATSLPEAHFSDTYLSLSPVSSCPALSRFAVHNPTHPPNTA